MKRSITLAFIAFISMLIVSCSNKKSNNIKIVQASTFNRKTHTYSLSTKLDVTNRFGFSIESDEWLASTKNADEVDELFKIQKSKAENVCSHYK